MRQNNNMKKRREEKIKYIKNEKIDQRTKIILTITLILFICIFIRIIYLNIFMGNYYKMKLNNEKEIYAYGDSAPRGRILDRNGNVLVDNKAVKTIYYQKQNNISQEEEINLAYEMMKILKLNYNKLTKRNKKEFYILINEEETNNLITKKEYEDLENRKIKEEDIYELKIKRITNKMLNKMTKEDNKAAYLYFLMNKGYSYDEKEIKTEKVTDREYAFFIENKNNLKGFYGKLEWERVYPYGKTLRTILGNVSSKEVGIPEEEKDYYLEKGYNLNDRVGISGLEKQYEELLKGEKAIYKIGDNNQKKIIKEAKKGTDIMLTIDIELQKKIDNMLKEELIKSKQEINTKYFNRSYIVIQNPTTGEIMSITGKEIEKKNNKYISYDTPEGAILLAVTPGSVVKGASMAVGYKTKVINIGTYMEDSCIKLYNLPQKCSWKTLGYINDLTALAQSSNVYQYKIAMKVGGFNYSYGKKLKIDEKAFTTYRKIFYQFGLGSKTGIDYPREEDGYKSNNKAGDLLINFAIGQYDTYTPIQLSQYISTIANGGKRYKMRFLKAVLDDKGKVLYEIKPTVLNELDIERKHIDRIKKGLNLVMTNGTGYGYMEKAPNPSGKTGTSESFIDTNNDGIIDKETISNNFVGYAPSNKPVMSVAASFPDIQYPASSKYKSYANQRIVSKTTEIFFSLYDKKGIKINKN